MKNKTKSLAEALGYKKATNKLTLSELRNMIHAEMLSEEKDEKKDDGAKAPAESNKDGGPEIPNQFSQPKMTSTPPDGTGNIKDVPAEEIVAQMLSGDPKAPVVQAIASFHNPKFTKGLEHVGSESGAKGLQQWALSKGPAFLANNIAVVQKALPSSGLPKSKMPALEPEDVSAVSDALSPGGSFNIDMTEPLAGDTDDVAKWFEDQKSSDGADSDEAKEQKEAISRVTLRLLEDSKYPQDFPDGMPGGSKTDPKDFALAFLTKGLKDGSDGDDSIEVKENEPINVAEMIPTQQNIQLGKSLAFALGGGFGGQELGAYVTGGNEILDGHHRWSGTMIVDPGAQIKGHKISAPADDILPALTALGNAFGNAQKGREKKEESLRNSDNVIIERWQKLAGIIKG